MELDELKSELIKLKEEISYLKGVLKNNNIDYLPFESFVADLNTNSKKEIIKQEKITKQHVILFYSLFKGRKDVYAKRAGKPNAQGKVNYYTQCNNFWKYGLCPRTIGDKTSCSECQNKDYKQLTGNDIYNHLMGYKVDCSDVIGIYPLLKDETCNFLVFDFDNHDKNIKNDDCLTEVKTLKKICNVLKIPTYIERSRSGNGYHVWLFFEESIKANQARKFGDLLIEKGCDYVNIKSFDYFDRMIPAQDNLPKDKNGNVGIGSLVALPLQGQAIKNNNSVFVDNDLNAYEDQWQIIRNIKKISRDFIENFIKENNILTEDELKPWDKRKTIYKDDIIGNIEIVLADKVYVNGSNIAYRSQNAIRRMCSFSNPEYYKNKAIGRSNYGVSRIIYGGVDDNKYICVPRGIKDELINALAISDVQYTIKDERVCNKTIKVNFVGELYPEQQEAVNETLKYETGIISATTAFGKTVVGANIISRLKVNALILVDKKEIQDVWLNDLNKFLVIDEELPEFKTKTGRTKTRKSIIGKLYGGHNSLTGIIDVVMLPSLTRKKEIEQICNDYSLIIIDECHHSAADSWYDVLNEFRSKYVYGLTATPKRNDGLQKLEYMAIGPVRYTYTALERNKKQGIGHYVYPRFTRLNSIKDLNINEAYKLVVNAKNRNEQIVEDVQECVNNKRTPLVLTKYKEHASILFEMLKTKADHVYLLQGGGSVSQKQAIKNELNNMDKDSSLIIVAIDKYIGEGFNYPRLDTLFLTMPIKWEGNVEQYAGRLNRDYEGKKEVIIYDYIDCNIRVLEKMYNYRLKTYKKIGYEIANKFEINDNSENKFYDSDDYFNAFVNDINKANKEVIISSVGLSRNKIFRFVNIIKQKQYAGVKFSIITLNNLAYKIENQSNAKMLIEKLKEVGVTIILKDYMYKHYAIIDNNIVWYGNANILSVNKEEDNMMRIIDEDIARQLIEEK